MDLETPLEAILAPLGLRLYDVELTNGALNVTVTKDGGVDLEEVTKANRCISEWLDEKDPIAGRYTLDVSSPGLERKLRTAKHFASTQGETVTLREKRDGEATRRLEGEVIATTPTGLTLRDKTLGDVEISYDNVERARTVFAWGAQSKPSPSKGQKKSPAASKKG
jgi:ribosome maturation factor RimP